MNIFSCQHASRMVSESMDRPLLLRERVTLRMHLMMCSFCTRFASQMQILRRAAIQHGLSIPEAATLSELTFSAEARARISRVLSEG